MKRSNAYKFTCQSLDDSRLTELKMTIKNFNKLKLEQYFGNNPKTLQYRVCVRGRIGKNNKFAKLYSRKLFKHIKHEHAQYFDVYVQSRYIYD